MIYPWVKIDSRDARELMSVNRDTSTADWRCVMHVCKIIIPVEMKEGEEMKKIELNWCYWYFLAWHFLVEASLWFPISPASVAKRRKNFIWFFRGMKRKKSQKNILLLLSHAGEKTLLRRRSRIHGWRILLFSMLNETFIIIK